ncbi:MAG: FAD-dependent oxidoreductase [Actinobacteria bacterium]|nr:FAD-dependent oxidoreductase [Actinomycetota bacterium]
MEPTFVVVGASLCGCTAAATLRDEGFDGRIVLIGEEPLPPYERPPLSKEYLRGEQPFEQAFLRPDGWYEEQSVETRFGQRVERVDPAGRAVVLAGGERIGFDAVLIATGSRNRTLSVPGADLPGVLSLRFASDADRIREAAARGGKAVVVGAGFIGCEVAASLRHLGLDVTMVEFFETPLYRVLGPDLGRVLEGLHRDHGVEMFFGQGVERIQGDGRFEAVVTTGGRRIEGDFAVVGVGVDPAVDVVQGTGIGVKDGISVDATLRTTVPGVFAAGDVARHDHPVFGPIRVEHWDNAIKMGQTAARNMMGRSEVFDDAHWFWSDQYDANIQMAGFAVSWDEMVVRGSLEERRFAAFLLKDGVLLSTFSMNRARDVRRSMPLIKARARPDPAALRDPDVDLRNLAPVGQ